MTPEELREAFKERTPVLHAFGKWVTERVMSEVERQVGSPLNPYFFRIPPNPRVKDVEGFVEKSTRKGKDYRNPLVDITDQVGTRFVVLLHKECVSVNDAIRSIQEWDCHSAKDIEEIRFRDPHHFDYESYHWTVALKEPLEIGGLTVTPDFVCEIQVRTLLQHAYAELAHSTVYKPKTAAAPAVRRIIARGAALIETTDCVFSQVAQEIQTASENQIQSLTSAAMWYATNVEDGHYPPSGIAQRIADSYSEVLSPNSSEDMKSFLSEKAWLSDAIKENRDKPLFGDPVIAVVFWLVSELRQDIYDNWPYDASMLQPVFSKLGIAAH